MSLVEDAWYPGEKQPLHGTLEVAPGSDMVFWQSPMSSFTLCVCKTSVGSGSSACCAGSQTRVFNLGSLSFTPKPEGTAQTQGRPGQKIQGFGVV